MSECGDFVSAVARVDESGHCGVSECGDFEEE